MAWFTSPSTKWALNSLATMAKWRFPAMIRAQGKSAFDITNRNSRFEIRNSQQVPHLHLFSGEISFVVRIGRAANRHLLDHLNAVTLESDHFLGIVGQETELPHAEIK